MFYLSVDISNMHNILISTTDTMRSKGQCEYTLESTCPSIYSLIETNVQHSNISFIFGVFSLHIWLKKHTHINSLKWEFVRRVLVATRITIPLASTNIQKPKNLLPSRFFIVGEKTRLQRIPLMISLCSSFFWGLTWWGETLHVLWCL